MGHGYDPVLHHRRSTRLQNYDYSLAGAYFVTICTHNRLPFLGSMVDGEMRLSAVGRIVEEEWLRTASLRPFVVLDAYVLMPNHLHGILLFDGTGQPHSLDQNPAATHPRAPLRPPAPSQNLGAIMRGFKSTTTSRCRRLAGDPSSILWQRNYYDHVIRSEEILNRIRAYIADNPRRWGEDRYYCTPSSGASMPGPT